MDVEWSNGILMIVLFVSMLFFLYATLPSLACATLQQTPAHARTTRGVLTLALT
jgi:hypothetical protein